MKYIALFASIATSEKMARLPDGNARLFFLALLPQCDSWGRIESSPTVLHAKVWPLWKQTPKSTLAARDACAKVGLVELHSADGREWVQVPGWDFRAGRLGRRDRRGSSDWPEPCDNSRITPGLVRDHSRSEERRGEEKRGEEIKAPPEPPPPHEVNLDAELLHVTEWAKTVVRTWVEHRRQLRQRPYTLLGLRGLVSKVHGMGDLRAKAALEHSLAGDYQGLFEPNQNGRAGIPRPAAKATERDVLVGSPEWKAKYGDVRRTI